MTDISSPEAPAQKRRPIFFGWYIVAASIATNAIFSAAYFQGFNALIIPIEREFQWQRWVISSALSIRQLESGIASPIIGLLLDKISPRKMILGSALISSVGLFGLGFINGWFTFFLFFFIISLGASGVSHAVTWPVVIARWFRRKRGLAMGLAVLGPIFGSPIVILNTQVEQATDWRVIPIAYGFIVLVSVSLLSIVVRDRPEPYGLRPDGDPPEDGALHGRVTIQSARRAEVGLTLREVLHTRDFWLLTAFLSGMFIVNSAFQAHQIPYFEQDVGFSRTGAAITLTLVFTISGIGRIGAGFLLDKLDYRIVLSAVGVLMGLGFLYLQLSDLPSVWATLPFVVLFGIGFGSTIPMRGALGSMMFGTRSLGPVIGLLQGGSVAAGVIGPIFLGVIFDLQGSYYTGMWALVVVSALMVPVALAMSSPAALAKRTAGMTSAG